MKDRLQQIEDSLRTVLREYDDVEIGCECKLRLAKREIRVCIGCTLQMACQELLALHSEYRGHPLLFPDHKETFRPKTKRSYPASLSPGEIKGVQENYDPEKQGGRKAIAGRVDTLDQKVYLTLADGIVCVVPLSYFKPNAQETPNFTEFSITDCGFTLKFGTYEACVETAIRSTVLGGSK